MSFESPSAHFAPSTPSEDALKVARSDFLDAYNEVDAALRDCLRKLGVASSQNFADNIGKLESCQFTPAYPQKKKKLIDRRLPELRDLGRVRQHIAHGRMTLQCINGQFRALFENVQSRSAFGMLGLIMTREDLDLACRRLHASARSLRDNAEPVEAAADSDADSRP